MKIQILLRKDFKISINHISTQIMQSFPNGFGGIKLPLLFSQELKQLHIGWVSLERDAGQGLTDGETSKKGSFTALIVLNQ